MFYGHEFFMHEGRNNRKKKKKKEEENGNLYERFLYILKYKYCCAKELDYVISIPKHHVLSTSTH